MGTWSRAGGSGQWLPWPSKKPITELERSWKTFQLFQFLRVFIEVVRNAEFLPPNSETKPNVFLQTPPGPQLAHSPTHFAPYPHATMATRHASTQQEILFFFKIQLTPRPVSRMRTECALGVQAHELRVLWHTDLVGAWWARKNRDHGNDAPISSLVTVLARRYCV